MELNHEVQDFIMTNELDQREEALLENEKYYDKNQVTDELIATISNQADKNIDKEILQQESLFKNVDKDLVKSIVKNIVEVALKVVLKKKFHISFSTFEAAKKTINSLMDGDTKAAVKSASDVALSGVKGIDSSTKGMIKSIKNTVIDETLDNSPYEITVKQTKVMNRLHENCLKFEEALSINDAATIKKKANAIQKDLKEVLPIKETLQKAQNALDKYELWKNNGNRVLSEEENAIIEKLNQSA